MVYGFRREKGLRVNDYVSISIGDYGGGSSTYQGMIISIKNDLTTVLFTDGDVCSYRETSKLKLLSLRESLIVGEKK